MVWLTQPCYSLNSLFLKTLSPYNSWKLPLGNQTVTIFFPKKKDKELLLKKINCTIQPSKQTPPTQQPIALSSSPPIHDHPWFMLVSMAFFSSLFSWTPLLPAHTPHQTLHCVWQTPKLQLVCGVCETIGPIFQGSSRLNHRTWFMTCGSPVFQVFLMPAMEDNMEEL